MDVESKTNLQSHSLAQENAASESSMPQSGNVENPTKDSMSGVNAVADSLIAQNTQTAPSAELTSQTESSVGDNDIIYMLRAMHMSHIHLNVMADQKANILMGIIGIVFTVLVTKLLGTQTLSVSLAFVVFGLVELVAFAMALLVVMPKVLGKMRSPDSIEDMPNPFFFHFYTRFDESTYISYMMETVKDNDAVRYSFYRDIYQLGCVLKRKYRLLKYAYVTSFTGLLLLFLLSSKYLLSSLSFV